MQKRYIVKLTCDERASLEDLAKRQRVSALKRQRALIVLRADDDLTDAEIAEELEVGRATVERVRRRCVERGIAAALDRKTQENPSRPRKFDGASEARLVQIACCTPPEGRTKWTLSLLGERLVAAMENVLDVYQRPHDPARPVVCLDETSKQLLAHTRVPILARAGHVACEDDEYRRIPTNTFAAGSRTSSSRSSRSPAATRRIEMPNASCS